MLRDSETFGLIFVWVTLFFYTLLVIFCLFCHCMCRFLLLFEFFVFLNYKSQRNFVWFSFFGSHALLTAIIL